MYPKLFSKLLWKHIQALAENIFYLRIILLVIEKHFLELAICLMQCTFCNNNKIFQPKKTILITLSVCSDHGGEIHVRTGAFICLCLDTYDGCPIKATCLVSPTAPFEFSYSSILTLCGSLLTSVYSVDCGNN